jgi:hypothetical protein
MSDETQVILVDQIEPMILTIRGQKIMLDSDLAELYGVTTKRLNEQVRRNGTRFPSDFVFQLAADEVANLRSQFATSSRGHGGRRYRPFAFTEHGAIMAATILNSPRAVEVSVFVVRAFVKLREFVAMHKELARKLAVLEQKYDAQFKVVFDAIRELMKPPEAPTKRRKIGFGRDKEE